MNINNFFEEIRQTHQKCLITDEDKISCLPTTLIPKKYLETFPKIFYSKSNGILLHKKLVYDFGENGYWYFDVPNAAIVGEQLELSTITSLFVPEAKNLCLERDQKVYFPLTSYPYLCIGFLYFLVKNLQMAPSKLKFSTKYANILKSLHNYEQIIKHTMANVTNILENGDLMEGIDGIMFDAFPPTIMDEIDNLCA